MLTITSVNSVTRSQANVDNLQALAEAFDLDLSMTLHRGFLSDKVSWRLSVPNARSATRVQLAVVESVAQQLGLA